MTSSTPQGGDDPDGLRRSWERLEAAAGVRRPRGGSLAERRVSEKPPLRSDDGRSLRATGRTFQLNLKVTAEFKEELRGMAEARGINMNELLERIVAEWKSPGGGKGRT